MKTYRDYLNERGVPEGPWVELELHNKVEPRKIGFHSPQVVKPVDKLA